MTALSPAFAAQSLRADRATRMTDTFEAWRVIGTEADPIAISATTLADALQQVRLHVSHKDVFIVRQTSAHGNAVLHHFAVKRSTKCFTHRPASDGGYPVKVGELYGDLLFSLAVTEFAPVEKWRWTRGADVVGSVRSVVEVRS